ncbi:MAG: hypothetical protein M1832_001031 [Thelocarpon impressellum]|nr:MAG: hypothetical protein M1832_001031 [Thelocarpon impressellum]
MEYFDFEEASVAHQQSAAVVDPLACAGLRLASSPVPVKHSDLDCLDEARMEEMLGLEPGVESHGAVPRLGIHDPSPRFFRSAVPCRYCRNRQLDCVVLRVGPHACSSCVSLARECSFLSQVDERNADAVPEAEHPDSPSAVVAMLDLDANMDQGSWSSVAVSGTASPAQGKSSKTGARFSREAVKVLKSWLDSHAHHPYPTDQEKGDLSDQTGLRRSQVSNWLANARRRGKVRTGARCQSPSLGTHGTAPMNIPARATSQEDDMTPLERWKASPPEHEPASVSAIADAVATSAWGPQDGATISPESYNDGQQDSSAGSSRLSAFFRAPSLSSLETRGSSGSDRSFISTFSHQSQRSFGSARGLIKAERRRRRRPAARPKLESQGTRMFQCTFCTDSFKTKHDWQRHEKSLHLSLEKWVCAPQGGSVEIPGGGRLCAYCSVVEPSAEHVETHHFAQCREKSVAERTFYRKDHLRQHLRLVHECKFDVTMEAWKTVSEDLKSRCGFCGEGLATWQARVDHLAGHFRGGMQMSEWKGDWGFEAHVLAALESDMPPWLIDQERRTPQPFSATARVARPDYYDLAPGSTPEDPIELLQDSRCYRRLEKLLAAFAQEQMAQGIVPTDCDLQVEARIILFVEPDAWNQTAADDAEWLGRFKQKMGLAAGRGAAEDVLAPFPYSRRG